MNDELMRRAFLNWIKAPNLDFLQDEMSVGKSQYDAFQAAWNQWAKQVVVLEDNAEPQVGDWVSVFSGKVSQGSYPDIVEQIIYGNDEGYPYTGNGNTAYVLESRHPAWCYADKLTIIHRGGKPCVYAKDLMGG